MNKEQIDWWEKGVWESFLVFIIIVIFGFLIIVLH